MIGGYAIVTGGAGDKGRASAGALAAAGFDVLILDIIPFSDGERLAADLTALGGGNVSYADTDCTDEVAVAAAVAGLQRLDFVLLNAAVVTAQRFLEVDATLWRRQIEVNLTGSFIVAQAAVRMMVAQGVPGHLLFMSSWVAERPWPELAAYTASKAAINQLSRQIAKELAGYGIRSNCLAPGIVHAGLSQGLLDSNPVYAARVASSIPLGEMQSASEIGEMVAVLAGANARSTTGAVVTMDGGCSLWVP